MRVLIGEKGWKSMKIVMKSVFKDVVISRA
jgi:hypothetical protein